MRIVKRLGMEGPFQRDWLPDPEEYYDEQGIELRGNGEWRSALCPFHDDNRPSLRVHVENGAFRCMACGEHGGGVLDFHMQFHKMDFKRAAKDLGAWDERL